MTPRPGTRWRARLRGKHRNWRVEVKQTNGRGVRFERLGGHREPAQKQSWMLVDAFVRLFALERGA
jgi:hypothetical protein